ncbi:MAG: lytic transglycosylase [Rubrivivax sp. SCN 71-131]|nr:MAG: lytic transglycosylase [Rubrivivax sp. SCN 71-131]
MLDPAPSVRTLAAGLLCACLASAQAQLPPAGGGALPGQAASPWADPALALESLPRPSTPPAERGTVVPAQVERWRREGQALEHGEGAERDAVKAAQFYCRAARYGDAEAQYSLAWMLTNARGIERDEAQAAHLFAAAAEQGHAQAVAMAQRLGTPRGDPPPCLRPPDEDPPLLAQVKAGPPQVLLPPGGGRPSPFPRPTLLPPPPPPAGAPPQIVRFVELVAPEYKLQPHVVLALIKQESNFDPLAVSPKNAQGLMQLIPDTARRFNVRNIMDPAQNLRGGMAYLRWLLATFEGDLTLALAAYNAGEGAVERYRGVPPYAETRLYVRRIIAAINGQRAHPFDVGVAAPSPMLVLLKARLGQAN